MPTDTITLARGAHSSASGGTCLLEAASYVAGEAFSDAPACVSPVLGAFGRALNDALDDGPRQQLRPFVERLLNTAGDSAADERRSYMALDWLIRVYLPTWLKLGGLDEQAIELEDLPAIITYTTAEQAGPIVRRARDKAAAAWDAARAAARAAAWDAARAAARAAAWAAAGDAAWAVAWAAAWAVAGDAARDAARDVLEPTVVELQASAIALFDRMIDAEAA